MAHKTTHFQGTVGDGSFLSPNIPEYLRDHFITTTFFSDADLQVPVTPTAGTVSVSVSDDFYNFGSVSNGDYAATDQHYGRPNAQGAIRVAKVTLAGVTGATKFRVTINSYT